MQQFTDLSGEASPGLGEADQAMRDSATQLNQGQDQEAGQSQQQAIAALQKGNKEMGQAMAKMGRQPGQGGEGEDGDQDGSEGAMGMMMPDGQRGDGHGSGPLPGSPDRADPGGRDPLGRVQPGELRRQRRRGGAGGAGAATHAGDPGGTAPARCRPGAAAARNWITSTGC